MEIISTPESQYRPKIHNTSQMTLSKAGPDFLKMRWAEGSRLFEQTLTAEEVEHLISFWRRNL